MAKDPAFLFYPNDWLGGTMGMSFEMQGAYLTLLILQFNKGSFDHEQAVNTIGLPRWLSLVNKFSTNGVIYWNERLKEESEKRKNFSESRRKNRNSKVVDTTYVNTSVNTYDDTHVNTHVKHMVNENRNANKDSDRVEIQPDFAEFWNLYDKKVDLPKSKAKWSKLGPADKKAIMAYIPEYKRSQPDKKYRKHPTTFLNNRSWENEIIYDNTNSKNRKGSLTNDELLSSIAKGNPGLVQQRHP